MQFIKSRCKNYPYIPTIVDLESKYSTSYEIFNLTKVITPILNKHGIDLTIDKIKVTVIYNSNKILPTYEKIINYSIVNRFLDSIHTESNELYHITKFFYPNEVNIIKVPSFYNIDIPEYDSSRYIQLGINLYFNSINY